MHRTLFWCGSRRAPSPRRRGGLTLFELIVVVSIIALLLSILLPVFRTFKQAARQTMEMNSARQTVAAYLNYSIANQGSLLIGYKLGLSACNASGHAIEPVAAAPYPWRLAPYLDWVITGMFSSGHRDLLDTWEGDSLRYNYGVGIFPSLGLNARWLGGDEADYAFDEGFISLFGKYYLGKSAQARRPADLITFASARGSDPLEALGTDVLPGYYKVESPWFTTPHWEPEYDADLDPADWGYVALRYNRTAVSALLDGHVDAMSERELLDMRHWADQATGEDWHLEANLPAGGG